MQVYIVNIQKLLILYTFAQKMVNIVQILQMCTKFANFFVSTIQIYIVIKLQYKFTL